MGTKIDRRMFHKTGVAATLGLTAPRTSKAAGANESIRLGFIGVANRGGQLLDAFIQHDDAEIVALCDELAPVSVCAMGGRFAIDDDRTIPDTMEVTFQYASGRLVVFGQYETSRNPTLRNGEIELRGMRGTVYVGGKGYEVVPERAGQFQTKGPRCEAETVAASEKNNSLTALMTRLESEL